MVSSELYEMLKSGEITTGLLPYLSAHLRQATDAGEETEMRTTTWEALARAHVGVSVTQKIRRLLEYFAATSSVGEWRPIGDEKRVAAMFDIKGPSELGFLIRHLHDSELLERDAIAAPNGQGADGGPVAAVRLTVEGWNAVAPMGTGVTGTCFVAMSFDKELNTAFTDGFMPALETDCGFDVVRVDRVHHNDVITDRIIAGIRSAQFVVADFTLQRQGVYYEAGFAQGLNRPVIRTCRVDDFDRLHFDTRQFFHLKWTTPADLRVALAMHVRATISGSRP